MSVRFTVLIAARNAEATIGRAVRSVVDEPATLVLVDDGSSDNTVAVASEAARGRLQVIRPAVHGTLGATRQFGLEAVDTPYAAWLDADDEVVAGRVERLTTAFDNGGHDVVADATAMVDGPTHISRGVVPVPDTLFRSPIAARLFERNPLPGIGLVAFCTATWLQLGYDQTLHGAEDVDIVLRAAAGRRSFGWLESVGMRKYAYPDSMSRRGDNQRRMYARALRKHAYDDISCLYAEAGWDRATTMRGLASMAIFRDEPGEALRFIDERPSDSAPNWEVAFMRGTASLLLGDAAMAVGLLREAEAIRATPEAANNLGVALTRCGRPEEGHAQFAVSLARFPGYLDAHANFAGAVAGRIATHPLRTWTW